MRFVFGITLAVLISALVMSYVQQSEANFMDFACSRSSMLKKVRDQMLEGSSLVRQYQEAMTKAKIRFEEAMSSCTSDEECEDIFYKIVAYELHDLRRRIESGEISEQNSQVGAMEESVRHCADPDALVEDWDPDSQSEDDDEELRLLTTPQDLERQAELESEMGWGALSEEARRKLKARTNAMLKDLVDNEVRQIGMAVVHAYFSGGTIAPALVAICRPMTVKLIEYFMNIMMDLATFVMNQRIGTTTASSVKMDRKINTTTVSSAVINQKINTTTASSVVMDQKINTTTASSVAVAA